MIVAEGTESVSTSYGDVQLPSAEGGAVPDAAPVVAQAPEVPWWEQHKDSEMEFQAAGKNVKAPFSKVKQWAQQGYDYGQRMQAYNAQKAELETRAQELAKDAEWADVVKFSRENPEWANHTREAWEARQTWQNENADNPILKDFQALRKEIEPLKAEAEALKAERQRIEFEKEDKALETELASVRDKYSKIGMDLAQIDPATGMSYELSALKYGSENGIKQFKTAFYELYGDKVEGLREEAIKKQVAEDHAKRTKEGFIGRSPTPANGQPAKAQNVKNRSWSSLAEEGLADKDRYL